VTLIAISEAARKNQPYIMRNHKISGNHARPWPGTAHGKASAAITPQFPREHQTAAQDPRVEF
jgi:hypothetical protein